MSNMNFINNSSPQMNIPFQPEPQKIQPLSGSLQTKPVPINIPAPARPKAASQLDQLYDKLIEVSKACVVTRYDGDYIIQYDGNTFALSDYVLGSTKVQVASDIVLACLLRQQIKVATELVIPLVPIKGMWNVVNNISSATSHLQVYANTVEDVVKHIEGEVSDWDQIIYRRGNALPSSKITGFSIQPGRLSPMWIPVLQEMAKADLSESPSVLAYQTIFGHMYYNQQDFKTMSLKEAEMVRAGAMLETLCSSLQGTMKYCMNLKHIVNTLDHHIQAVVVSENADKDRMKIVRPQFKKGKNPYVSYAGKGDQNKERLNEIISKRSSASKKTTKAKYKSLNDYEMQQINEMFAETSRCSMPKCLNIHSYHLEGMRINRNAKRTAFRVTLPTILKSQDGYVPFNKTTGFGEAIISPSMTEQMFKDETITQPVVNGHRILKAAKEFATTRGQKTYQYTFVAQGDELLANAVNYYKNLEKPKIIGIISERKEQRQGKFSSQRKKKDNKEGEKTKEKEMKKASKELDDDASSSDSSE